MSQRVTDPFIWKDEEWVFLGADDVYSLFDPEKYGLHPSMPSTACYKGFIIQFSVRDSNLYLDRLAVYCDDGSYPPINSIEPSIGTTGMQEYSDLNIPLKYSGIVIVGREIKPEYEGRAFTGPHSYETTYELEFRDGILVHHKDTSGAYFGF